MHSSIGVATAADAECESYSAVRVTDAGSACLALLNYPQRGFGHG